jgi:hypothetical protein
LFEALSRLEVAVVLGVIGAVALVLLTRWLAPRREMLVYSVGLGVTAVAYLLFGLQREAPANHLGLELVGTVLYGTAAVLGAWRWTALLAFGWTTHVVWDLFFHYASGPAFAPVWWPLFCVGFDVFVGGYIAGRVVAPPRQRQ